MKRLAHIFCFVSVTAILAVLAACHSVETYDNSVDGNFEQLWRLFDEHYCFFEEKGIDWDEVHDRYAPQAARCRTQQELFRVCSDMLAELKDGHVNLISSFDTYYYREWWSGYPQNFNIRVIQQNYLFFNYRTIGAVSYATLPQNIGYIYIPTFATGIGEGNLDNILNSFASCPAIIIDVRDNGGGSITNVETWISRFIHTRTLVGYILHKDGPGHNDFSKPYPYYFSPSPGHVAWRKPIVVLTNRSTFSAANNFVSIIRLLPDVTVIGDRTGGGSGMPLSYELPVGWGVRMSAAPVLDANGESTESGISPSPGFEVNISPEDTAAGRDPILDAAIRLLSPAFNDASN